MRAMQGNGDRAKTKDALVALQYLNLNLGQLGLNAPQGERRSHQILVTLLSIRDLRDQWSIAPILALLTSNILSPDLLRRIETLIPNKKREDIARIRCESLSNSSPATLVFKLIHSLDPSKINAILGELASRWGFERPSWSKYFDSMVRYPRDQAMLDFLALSSSDISKYSHDRLFVLMAVKIRGAVLEKASKSLQNDREIVLAAVRQDGGALKHASQILRNDREIVLAAVQQNGGALKHASPTIRNERSVVLAAVTQCGCALSSASDSLINDREIVLTAVQQDGLAVEHADESLKRDREIVLAAVTQHGGALEHASLELRDDREIVLAAVRCSGDALMYVRWSLRNDRDVVLTALGNGGRRAIEFIPYSLCTDHEIMRAAEARRCAPKPIQRH